MKRKLRHFLWEGKLRDVFEIISYRDGCVWETKRWGLVVCDPTHLPFRRPVILASVSTGAVERIVESEA